MIKNIKKTIVLMLIVSMGLMTSCAKAYTKSIVIGIMSDIGAVPFLIADEKGFFEDRGLDVEIVVFKSAIDRDSALQTGNLDAAMADMLSIVFYTEANLPVKMVAKTAGDYVMVTSPQMSLSQFNQSESPSIGISSNTVIEFATEMIAKADGNEQHVESVVIPQMPVRLEMLRSGELDAATLPEPLASSAVLSGGTVVGSTEDIGLEPGILVFTDALIDDAESTVAIFEAYNDAAQWLNENDEATIYDMLTSSLGFSELLKDQGVLPIYNAIEAPNAETFDAVSEWMFDKGVSKHKYNYDALTDINLIPQDDF
jgi:NitT/TauT family transport system substrate-binding protein